MPGTQWYISAMGCQCTAEAAVTCSDVKNAYKDSKCCGMPDKAFDVGMLSAKADAAPKPSAAKTNLLLITYDGWRWDWDGTHDNIDMRGTVVNRITAKGVRFDKAYSPAPVCAPSRSAMAMAMSYEESPVKRNGLGVPSFDFQTFYTSLRNAGYFIMGAGKDHIRQGLAGGIGLDGKNGADRLGWDAGIGTDDTWEFAKGDLPGEPYGLWLYNKGMWDEMVAEYGTYPFTTKPSSLCYNADFLPTDAGDMMVGASNWCPNKSSGMYVDEYRIDFYTLYLARTIFGKYYLADPDARAKPWMYHLNFMGGHPPMIMTTEGWANTADRILPSPVNAPIFAANPDISTFLRKSYTGLVEDVDGLTNNFLDFVDGNSPGGLDNILVFLTADHGELLGDFDLTRKQTQHEPSCRVPLAVMGPGIKGAGRVIKYPVTTLDIAGTMMEVAGATPADSMSAVSLMPLINDGTPVRTMITSGLTMGTKDFRVRWKQYNSTTTLKFFCCRGGCPASTMVPVTTSDQVGLFTVTDAGDGVDVMASGVTEALELLGTMSQDFQDACMPLIPGQR